MVAGTPKRHQILSALQRHDLVKAYRDGLSRFHHVFCVILQRRIRSGNLRSLPVFDRKGKNRMLHRFMELDFHLDAESLVFIHRRCNHTFVVDNRKVHYLRSLVSILYQLRIRNQAFSPEAFFRLFCRYGTGCICFGSLFGLFCTLFGLFLFFCLVIVLVGKNLLVDIDCLRRFSNHHLFSFVNQKTSLTVLDDAAHIVGNEKDRFSCFFQIVKFPVTLGLEENVSDA